MTHFSKSFVRRMVWVFILPVFWGQGFLYAQDGCFECHGDPDLTIANELGNETSLYVDSTKYVNSIHGEFDCTDCHADVAEIPHEEKLQKVDCAACHEDEALEYQKSIHAQARVEGAPDAPECTDCHGKHDILPSSNPASRTNPLKLAQTCAVCHSDPKIVKQYNIVVSDPLAAYKKSVHGVALLSEKNFDAATCNSCHGSHDIRTMGDPESPIYWKNVPATCGQCHGEIFEQYTESVHWTAALRGIRQAPVCTGCHGEHEVRAPTDPKSPVNPLRVSISTCGRCHASEVISQSFGMPEFRVSTYERSYHGLAIRAGSLTAANCASCHAIHNILPSSDPRSTVNPANLQKTCGGCHKDATANFTKGPVHLTRSTTPGRVVVYIQEFYVGLIAVVIGLMILHNGADFIHRARKTVRRREEE